MKVYSQPMTKVLSMMVGGNVCTPPLNESPLDDPKESEDAPLF